MKAEIEVTRIYRFKIDPEDYGDGVTSWQEALDQDIRTGAYEDFGDFEDTLTSRLLSDTSVPFRVAEGGG